MNENNNPWKFHTYQRAHQVMEKNINTSSFWARQSTFQALNGIVQSLVWKVLKDILVEIPSFLFLSFLGGPIEASQMVVFFRRQGSERNRTARCWETMHGNKGIIPARINVRFWGIKSGAPISRVGLIKWAVNENPSVLSSKLKHFFSKSDN